MIASFYDNTVLKFPKVALALAVLVVIGLCSQLGKLQLDASSDSLVLEGDESLELFREVSQRYQSEEFLLVTYRPNEQLFSAPSLATLKKLRNELAELPGVSSVVSILDVPLLDSPRVSISQIASGNIPSLRDEGVKLDAAEAEFRSSPIYRELLVSADGNTTGIQVNLKRDDYYASVRDRRDELREKPSLTETEAAELAAKQAELDALKVKATKELHTLIDMTREILVDYKDEATVFLGGVPMIASDMLSFVQSDLRTFGAGILIFIVVLLGLIFRRVVWVALPLLTCVMTCAFMLGLLATLDWRMTVISSNFVALLLIITLALAIHLVVRYRELAGRQPEADQQSLVLQTTHLMAAPCFYTALTTVVAFMSLIVSGIRPVIDFGWMMTVGIGVAFVMTFVVVPAGLMLVGRLPGDSDADSAALSSRFGNVAARFPGPIFAVAFTILALALWGITQLKVENRFIDYFDSGTEIYQGMETIDAELGGTIPLEILIDAPSTDVSSTGTSENAFAPPPADMDYQDDFGSDDFGAGDDFGAADSGAFEEPSSSFAEPDDFGGADDFAGDDFGSDDFGDNAAQGSSATQAEKKESYWFTVGGLRQIDEVHKYVDSLEETGKVLSLATLYELIQMILGGGVDNLQLKFVQNALPAEIKSILVDPYIYTENGYDQARITIRVKETSRSLKRNQLLQDVRSHLVNELGFAEDDVHMTGMLVLYNNMLQSLFRSQILTLSAVFIAIMVMFLVLFRSLWLALIALAPNILAAGSVLGGMGLAGIPLDIMTITIAAITVGIGVDHAIHYVHRFQKEFPVDRNYLAAMHRCHGSIGKAMFYTAVIIIFGFSILMLSNFTPSIYFGLLTGVAMFAALMGSLLLLPRLILLFKPLGPESMGSG